jgi:hypothetical protein
MIYEQVKGHYLVSVHSALEGLQIRPMIWQRLALTPAGFHVVPITQSHVP